MTREYKTLREHVVQPGDVVEPHRDDAGECFPVCHFTITGDGGIIDAAGDKWGGDDGFMPSLPEVSRFRIVSRASDTSKLWRDMTPEEQGALLLAHHEGKVIEFCNETDTPNWKKAVPNWADWCAYRIRPEPKRETVTVHWGSWRFTLGRGPSSRDTHRITFDLIDGTLPAGVYTSQDGHTIKVEEL